ncbi:hypothetical protein CEXT_51031 [Caerostris extrusa]|uniref:Uncharacterized protein n=1 Tax=Caerostris extrusa TaxID=172846 RepID=A0AAV4N0B9_CAEEX|nr:hypothetical protein CEXT_51031 [Caerostris extrusa]
MRVPVLKRHTSKWKKGQRKSAQHAQDITRKESASRLANRTQNSFITFFFCYNSDCYVRRREAFRFLTDPERGITLLSNCLIHNRPSSETCHCYLLTPTSNSGSLPCRAETMNFLP